jgi:hypothetical protein
MSSLAGSRPDDAGKVRRSALRDARLASPATDR